LAAAGPLEIAVAGCLAGIIYLVTSGMIPKRMKLVYPRMDFNPNPQRQKGLEGARLRLERVKGIEPSYAAWEAAVLPLNYTRVLE
jgi:hypothetical protein